MTDESLAIQLKGIEVQIAVLKAQLKRKAGGPRKSFARLEGLLAGQVSSTEEEIEAAKYRLKWNDETMGETKK